MRKLHTRHEPIATLQHAMLCRHRWYRTLRDARATRRARSHAAAYRAINRRRRALHELARQDRLMWERLNTWGNRFRSVNDPIEAEVYRLRCELYNALAAGADVERAFERHYEQAEAACERFNAGQEARMSKRDWHPTHIGHYSPEAAWQRLRHAVRMYQEIARR